MSSRIDPNRHGERFGGLRCVVEIDLSYKEGDGRAKLKWEERTKHSATIRTRPQKHDPINSTDSFTISRSGFGNWDTRITTPCDVGKEVAFTGLLPRQP